MYLVAMNVIDYTLSIFVFTTGVVISLFLLRCMLVPVLPLFLELRTGFRTKRIASQIAAVDAAIDTKQWKQALALLKESFHMSCANSRQAVYHLREHHQNVLSRCLVVAEEIGSRLENIGDVERLLLQRSELQLLCLKASESFQKLKLQRRKQSKELPDWSKNDFERRVDQVKKEIAENEKELQKALQALFTAIDAYSADSIVYH